MQVETHPQHPDDISSGLSEVGCATPEARQEIKTPALVFATNDVGIGAVDEWLVCLVEAHETIVRAVLSAHRRAAVVRREARSK